MDASLHRFASPQAALSFALAGRAVLTLQSERTGVHFTYQLRRAEADKRLWYVSVLNGPQQFVYMAVLDDRGPRATRKSAVGADAPAFRAFSYWWQHAAAGKAAPHCTARHEGRCGRCHRALTHPESLDAGIGPECATKMECA